MEKLYDICTSYSQMILRAAFDEEDGRVESMLDGSEKISLMRLFHYFVAGDNETSEKEVLGSSPHRDWGLLTLILQDAPGLEYFDGFVWKKVPYIPGSLVVNGGDFLNMLCEDFKSPIHRVLAPTTENRMSFVFFFYPSYETLLRPPSSRQSGSGVEIETSLNGDKHSDAGMEFNTLTSILESTDDAPFQFGDAVVLKWKGVQA